MTPELLNEASRRPSGQRAAANFRAAERREASRRVSEALAGWQALELPGEYYQVLKPKGDDIFAILKAFGMELKPQLYTRGILKAFGMELKPQLYTRGEIREMKATASPF